MKLTIFTRVEFQAPPKIDITHNLHSNEKKPMQNSKYPTHGAKPSNIELLVHPAKIFMSKQLIGDKHGCTIAKIIKYKLMDFLFKSATALLRDGVCGRFGHLVF